MPMSQLYKLKEIAANSKLLDSKLSAMCLSIQECSDSVSAMHSVSATIHEVFLLYANFIDILNKHQENP
ncbi:hypothetical protein CWI42_090550 [Ordospora colligata]|uniref:Uncharacterized protein n=1 Tax=Ordospora colligata OC4 TaxID=1354746 RepID=A0A0B2UJH2_9MICR|nr:uncharacterized protein M896_090550 [Ordospora colligata OC4]KHN69130.1 hypothetical protein M896_090550 [Ordospora colligata OC4]TBU14585.1 hypothetical protein CWI41_090550 [Ordospora colligata]TBU14779.1 hypothetical protein CWI40_090560 [Ordospora colligata]TBU18213.1 hypothetical protein CWI42_090550 [Ordospora colligata]